MSRYIDADALIDRLDYCVKEGMGSTIAFTFKHMVEDAPSIDIEPKRGKWIDMGDFEQCSVCKGTHLKEFQSHYGKTTWIKTPYCPNCGADMREREGE